ncbi:hypothetical protein [Gemmatimonas groenlandica]|uniref:Lipoprotein n=1 Tax=Gemmatimonas groenlandica TaxID=2732249 RepID=A0A6M4IKZ8_9BACT|nr:hypothetical protein [Gemmatimonas groenlandica]QJR34548.1 hypothetical protein HKW67_02950 [Gemmatimonas groenlandica]
MNASFNHRLRVAAASMALTLSAVAGCRPSAPSSPSETAAQFYTLLDGLGVDGVPDSLALDAVQPYLDSTLVGLLVEARHARDDASRRAPGEKPPFVEGDMFGSLFEGNTSFGIRRLAKRGDTTFAVMAFTNAMQPPTVKWTDTLVIVPRANAKPKSPQFVIADLRYGAGWDFGNRGSLLQSLRAALSPDSASAIVPTATPAACATPPCGTSPR